jgi:hypothetical protein
MSEEKKVNLELDKPIRVVAGIERIEGVEDSSGRRYAIYEPGAPVGASVGHGDNTPTSKDTNPKDAVAVAHIKFSSLPLRVLVGPALALSEGGWKYGRHNYRAAGVNASVYFDAALDHLFAWFEGEDTDPASGLHHLDKLLAGVMVLRDAQLGGKWVDDRPPSVRTGWIEDAHARTKDLFARMAATYPEPKKPFVRGQGNDE